MNGETSLMTIERIIDGLLEREGRTYTNDPADHGGPTKFGVTLGDWQLYTGKPATPAEIEALTELQARDYYYFRYIAQPGFDMIEDEWLRVFIIDTAVLEGLPTAIKMVQKIVGTKPDGIFGPLTRAALKQYHDLDVLKRTLLVTRVHHLIDCALSDVPSDVIQTTNLKFLHGWWNRVTSFI
jgi:lysozyme family protein